MSVTGVQTCAFDLGRKPNENKRKHAEYANELRSQLPPKTWKECAVTVNENFGLTGDDSYTFERIRGLHRLKCGDKATGK